MVKMPVFFEMVVAPINVIWDIVCIIPEANMAIINLFIDTGFCT